MAAARQVSLFASALPWSSLCLLVCLRVLLAGVLLGFSDSGCSSCWVVAVSFPGLLFCQWDERPCACCPGLLAGCLCFLPGGRFPFCWLCLGLRVYSPSFHSPRPRSRSLSLSLSLSAFSCSSLSPLGFTGWGLCLSWLLSRLGLSLTISWWPTYWYPCISFRFSSGRSFPPSWWGPALLLRCTSFQSVLLVIRGISCSSWLSPLHSARFWFIVFSVPCGWVGALFPSVRLALSLSLSLAYWLFPSFFCHSS